MSSTVTSLATPSSRLPEPVLLTAAELIETGPRLSVGVLAADLLRLGAEVDLLESLGVELLHVDVMDGVFCPTTSLGSPIVRALPDRFVRDVHLMISEPVERLAEFVDAGADVVTFHLEATADAPLGLRRLGEAGVLRGVALNPGTPAAAVGSLLDELDLVLILAVEPGVSGQRFSTSTPARVGELRRLIGAREVAVGVDGGVTLANIEDVASLGVDLVVAGSAVFGRGPTETVPTILGALEARRPESAW